MSKYDPSNCGRPVEKVLCRRARTRPDFRPIQTSMTHVSKPRLRIAPPRAPLPAYFAIPVMVGMWLITILLPPSSTAANENPPAPEAVVRQMIDSIRKLRTTENQASRTKLIFLINHSLALDSLSQQALGAEWGKLDSAQRDQFLHLIRELLEKLAYPKASEFFADLDVQFEPEQAQGARRIVPTTVKRADGGAVSITYVMQRTHGQWQVVDINLDGQSLSQSVTGQIQAVLRQGSYQSLIDQMKARLR
jgi:phospholipid transport system substrate-binding protein